MPRVRSPYREAKLHDPEFQFRYDEVKRTYGIRMELENVAEYRHVGINTAREWLKTVPCVTLGNGKKIWWTYEIILKDCEELCMSA